MQKKEANRYVRLTDSGLSRLQAVRRRYKTPLDSIDSPSVNTMKRALSQGAVFRSTLERLWEYFGRSASENGGKLPPPVEGEDYISVPTDRCRDEALGQEPPLETTAVPKTRKGWISRQVPPPNRLFTGRQAVLTRLHAALQDGQAALIADPQALTGLGGIGKTQTALAYLYTHRHEYEHVFWASAETVEMLDEALAEMAEELHLLQAAPSAKTQALAAMRDWFRNETGWLLVLDNADDLERLAPHFPRHHAGHLLLTTRAANTVKWAAPVTLTRLEPRDGALLLLRRAGLLGAVQLLGDAPAETAQAALLLCEEFDGLPLALDQAGAYLSQTTALTVADYHALYRAYGMRHLDRVIDPEHASVTVTFTLALEQLARRSGRYAGAAADMVRLCAFLAPDAIPEAVLSLYCSNERNQSDRYAEICAAVCGYSLLVRNAEAGTLTIHRLVQAVMRDSLSPEERRRWRQQAIDAVAAATPDFEFEDWPLCDLLLPQWRLCADYITNDGLETASAAYLLYQAGRYHRARALYERAEAYTRQAVALAEAVYGPAHRITADYLDELACLYRVLDRRNESEALHLRAVAILDSLDEPERSLVGAKLHNMALLYVHYEEYAQAEAPFRRALAIYEAQPEPDRLLIATTLTQLAGVYRTEGRYDLAEPFCLRALAIYESTVGQNHIDTATGCNNLALLYLTMGRDADAEKLYRRALKINEAARGLEHPETGTVLWGLARACWKQQRFVEAEARFQQAIQIYTAHFGSSHSRTTRILSSYAEFQQAARLPKNAAPMLE